MISEYQSVLWDYVIVGTGMGGATLGYELARAGRRVLFLEKGKDYLTNPDAVKGDFLESYRERGHGKEMEEVSMNAGRSSTKLFDVLKGKSVNPILGSGTGGSTALYGMLLDRFFPQDFEPRRYHPHAEGNSLPERWPVSFPEMEPYYRRAERLYRVTCNESDPLRTDQTFEYLPGQPLAQQALRLRSRLEKKGFHPYPLPLALDWVDDCTFCQGFLCGRQCKNDSAKISLNPSLACGAVLLTRCQVARLEADAQRVTAIHARLGSENLVFRARHIVLAAGALETPLILLRSRSDLWPQGLANRSGLVGRNLMRHFIDIYTLFSRNKLPKQLILKDIMLNDFYCLNGNGEKFGMMGSFGHLPPTSMLLDDIREDLKGSWFLPVFNLFEPITGGILEYLFSRAGYMSTIIEDPPYPDNRVMWREDAEPQVAIEYRIRPADWERIHRLRRMVRKIFWPNPFFLIAQADNLKFIAHACGTCRFGEDPALSVLNKFNRTHDLENLYVVDASFFPSSGGTTPALTIAANALRVADHLLGKGV